MALFLSVELGDRIRIGASTITFEKKSGRQVRVRVDSSEDLHVEKGAGSEASAPQPPTSAPAEAVPPSAAQPVQLTRNGLNAPR